MIESILEPLFHKTSTKKHWTFAEVGTNFEIHENNISFESLSYYQSICDADRLDFGRCTSAHLSVEFLNIALELTGRTFDVSFTFEDEPNTPFVLGRFTVTEDKPSPDRKSRSVTMYDALYSVLSKNYASWYNAITENQWSSMTLGGFIDSFLTHVGITTETSSRNSLINANMPVSKTLATEQLLGSDILYAVCQVAGCFGVMTYDNKFRFLYLKSEIEGLFPANDLYPADDLYPVEPVTTHIPNSEYYPPLVYETFMTPSITALRIAESTEDVGTTIGSGNAGYEIIGNFLFFGKSASDLNTYGTNTLGAMTQRNYRPYSVEKLGNLCFEIGDPIRLGNEDMSVESYMLTRTFRGVQAFTDEISAEGTQDYVTVASSISTTVDKLQSKTLVLKQDIDEVSRTMTYQLDPTAGEPGGTHNSYAYQTAQEIGRKVETTTYNDFVTNTYGTFVTQTDSSLTAKAEKTVGNFTTGFSCTLDTTGHTWYRNNQQVMKVDGNGLTVTGTIKGSKFYCGTPNYETTLIDSEGKTARFANNTINFSDTTFEGTRIISADIAKGIFHVDYFPDDNEAGISIGNSRIELSEFDILNPVDLSIRRVETGNELTVLELWEYNDSGDTRVMLGTRHDRTEMPTQTYVGGKSLYLDATDNNNIYFNRSKTLKNILDDVSSAVSAATGAIKWGSTSGIEIFSGTGGSGIAINSPSGTSEVHVGYSSSQLTLGSSSTAVRIKGHEVQYHSLTIGPTTYHLLGYT